MVEASKFLFDSATEGVRCCELIHPWTKGCMDGTLSMLFSAIKGSYKFYAALYIVQIILKGKKINKEYLQRQFRSYLFSGGFGVFVCTAFVTFNCILRNIFFSKFHYYTTVFLPCFLGGAGIFFEPPHRRYLVISTFFNLVLEYWVRTLELKGLIRRTPQLETLLFMCGSSYLFYLMRQERDKDKKMSLLWFFTPPKVKHQLSSNGYIADGSHKSSSYCPHTGMCRDYIAKGALQMFALGCAMSMLRTVVPRLSSPSKALRSITRKHMSLGMFLGGYQGIYRLVTCMMCRHHRRDAAEHALPAGFLAGTAFWFNPNLSIALASITSILHIWCSRLYEYKLLPPDLPLPELLYALCQGLLYHARVMHPDSCPRYIVNLLNTVSGGKVQIIYSTFLTMILKHC